MQQLPIPRAWTTPKLRGPSLLRLSVPLRASAWNGEAMLGSSSSRSFRNLDTQLAQVLKRHVQAQPKRRVMGQLHTIKSMAYLSAVLCARL